MPSSRLRIVKPRVGGYSPPPTNRRIRAPRLSNTDIGWSIDTLSGKTRTPPLIVSKPSESLPDKYHAQYEPSGIWYPHNFKNSKQLERWMSTQPKWLQEKWRKNKFPTELQYNLHVRPDTDANGVVLENYLEPAEHFRLSEDPDKLMAGYPINFNDAPYFGRDNKPLTTTLVFDSRNGRKEIRPFSTDRKTYKYPSDIEDEILSDSRNSFGFPVKNRLPIWTNRVLSNMVRNKKQSAIANAGYRKLKHDIGVIVGGGALASGVAYSAANNPDVRENMMAIPSRIASIPSVVNSVSSAVNNLYNRRKNTFTTPEIPFSTMGKMNKKMGKTMQKSNQISKGSFGNKFLQLFRGRRKPTATTSHVRPLIDAVRRYREDVNSRYPSMTPEEAIASLAQSLGRNRRARGILGSDQPSISGSHVRPLMDAVQRARGNTKKRAVGTIQKSNASKAFKHLEFLHPKQASHFREMLSNPKTRGKAIKAIEAIKSNSSMTSRLARDIEVMRQRIANPSIKSKVPSRSKDAIRQNVMNVLEPAMFYRRLKSIPSDTRRSAISERIRTNKYNLPK